MTDSMDNSPNSSNAFLEAVSGVIHVGANIGQERDLYARYNLTVVWIEPIPEVFKVLERNLERHEKQKAYNYLITDRDDQEYAFNIANNYGASSSILDLELHKDIWPEVQYVGTIRMKGITLASFAKKENIDLTCYDALVMDTQGSELLVLKGAGDLLRNFSFIKTEVPDFESYRGCCQIDDIEDYLKHFGFRERSRHLFATRIGGGAYYDVIYEKDG